VGHNRGRGGAILTPNELVLPFGGFYVCANFCENRSRNVTVRVLAVNRVRIFLSFILISVHTMQSRTRHTEAEEYIKCRKMLI